MDTMTQYGLRSQEKLLSKSEGRARATGQPRVIASGDHVEGRLERSKGGRRSQGELSREDVHDILQGAARPTRMARSCRLTAERVALTHLRQRPQGQCVWRFSVRDGDLAKSKTKRKGKAEHHPKCILCFLIVFDKVGKPTNGTIRRPAVQAGGTAWQKPNDMV